MTDTCPNITHIKWWLNVARQRLYLYTSSLLVFLLKQQDLIYEIPGKDKVLLHKLEADGGWS